MDRLGVITRIIIYILRVFANFFLSLGRIENENEKRKTQAGITRLRANTAEF
jgi:hypothetical protein